MMAAFSAVLAQISVLLVQSARELTSTLSMQTLALTAALAQISAPPVLSPRLDPDVI